MRRKNPRVDLDKHGHKDKKRIDDRLNQIKDDETKKSFLKMCIDLYYKNSIKLVTRRERDHYTDVQKYCEKLLKGMK